MTRDRSDMGRAIANIDQQIGELQLVRQLLIDAFGPARELDIVKERLGDVPTRRRLTKAEIAESAGSHGQETLITAATAAAPN